MQTELCRAWPPSSSLASAYREACGSETIHESRYIHQNIVAPCRFGHCCSSSCLSAVLFTHSNTSEHRQLLALYHSSCMSFPNQIAVPGVKIWNRFHDIRYNSKFSAHSTTLSNTLIEVINCLCISDELHFSMKGSRRRKAERLSHAKHSQAVTRAESPSKPPITSLASTTPHPPTRKPHLPIPRPPAALQPQCHLPAPSRVLSSH